MMRLDDITVGTVAIGDLRVRRLGYGAMRVSGARNAEIADERGITSQQVALAWALAHSPAMLPIPGTSKLPHLDENIDAAFVELSKHEIARLESAAVSA
jgi:pyridoxine 4-dehydrogenase